MRCCRAGRPRAHASRAAPAWPPRRRAKRGADGAVGGARDRVVNRAHRQRSDSERVEGPAGDALVGLLDEAGKAGDRRAGQLAERADLSASHGATLWSSTCARFDRDVYKSGRMYQRGTAGAVVLAAAAAAPRPPARPPPGGPARPPPPRAAGGAPPPPPPPA